MKYSKGFIPALVYLSLMLAACTPSAKNETAEVEEEEEEEEMVGAETVELSKRQMETVSIMLGSLEKKSLDNVLRVNGELKLNPQDRAEVSTLAAGIVRNILVTEGQMVKAGQVVAVIENTDMTEMQSRYINAQRELEVAQQELTRMQTIAGREAEVVKRELTRQQQLANDGVGVEKNWLQARNDVDMNGIQADKVMVQLRSRVELARAAVEGIRRQMVQLGISTGSRNISVTAPIAGMVSRINIGTGAYVDVQTPLMTVADNSHVYAELRVFQDQIDDVRVGQSVELRHSNMPTGDLSGTVQGINHTINAGNQSLAVRVSLSPHPDHELVSGMYVNALIHTGQQQCDALPSEAIVQVDGKQYVFMLDGQEGKGEDARSTFRRVEVIPGSTALGYTALVFPNPVPEGAQFVVSGAFYLGSMVSDHGEEE